MRDAPPPCPRCGAAHVVRNGLTRAGSVNLRCRGCGRRPVPGPKRSAITPDTGALGRRPPPERLSPRAVARSAGVCRPWLRRFVHRLYREGTPPPAAEKRSGDLTVGADESRSFVGDKGRARRVRAAAGGDTRQVVAPAAGDRSADTAGRPWAALPAGRRDRAVARTDVWSGCRAAVPGERHARAGKGAGLTCGVERFWNTPRRRAARPVRKTLSSSKCDRDHVGAPWPVTRPIP